MLLQVCSLQSRGGGGRAEAFPLQEQPVVGTQPGVCRGLHGVWLLGVSAAMPSSDHLDAGCE